jgi:hypothetical protein
VRSHGTATARSQGSQCDQSSNPLSIVAVDQQRAEARAVDEQLAFDPLAAIGWSAR